MTHETALGTQIERALNAWASARHHRAQGGAGHPVFDETQSEPSESSTPNKYVERQRSKIDFSVVAAIESVDRALVQSTSPRWFVNYLLQCYPCAGRFVPSLPSPTGDPQRDFIARQGMRDVTGGLDGPQLERSLTRLIQATERAFAKRLLIELRNRPLI